MMVKKCHQSTYQSDDNSRFMYFQTLTGWTKIMRLHWRWSELSKTFSGVFWFPAISPQLRTRGLMSSEIKLLDAAPLWAGPPLQSPNHDCLKPCYSVEKASDSLFPNSGLAVVVFNTNDPLPTAAGRASTELRWRPSQQLWMKNFMLAVSEHWNSCPGRPCCLPLWRHSKPPFHPLQVALFVRAGSPSPHGSVPVCAIHPQHGVRRLLQPREGSAPSAPLTRGLAALRSGAARPPRRVLAGAGPCAVQHGGAVAAAASPSSVGAVPYAPSALRYAVPAGLGPGRGRAFAAPRGKRFPAPSDAQIGRGRSPELFPPPPHAGLERLLWGPGRLSALPRGRAGGGRLHPWGLWQPAPYPALLWSPSLCLWALRDPRVQGTVQRGGAAPEAAQPFLRN